MRQFEDRTCYINDSNEQKTIDIRICLVNTSKECHLSKEERGKQKIGLTNWRGYVATVEVNLRSVNQNVKFGTGQLPSDSIYEYTKEIAVPSSQFGDRQDINISVPVERDDNGGLDMGTVRVSVDFEYEEALEGRRDGPVLDSIIRFV